MSFDDQINAALDGTISSLREHLEARLRDFSRNAVRTATEERQQAVKAAVDAGSKAASKVGELVSSHIIARPHDDLLKSFLGEANKVAK